MATSGKGTGIVGYNVQAAVDARHHLIVAHDVTNVGHDRAELARMVTQAKDANDRLPSISADNDLRPDVRIEAVAMIKRATVLGADRTQTEHSANVCNPPKPAVRCPQPLQQESTQSGPATMRLRCPLLVAEIGTEPMRRLGHWCCWDGGMTRSCWVLHASAPKDSLDAPT